MTKLKVSELRDVKKSELLKKVEDAKQELAALRVAQVTSTQATKLGKIKVVRKNVARLLTVLSQNARAVVRKQAKDLRYKPKMLREKKTRAMRRALTPKQTTTKTTRSHQLAVNFPLRRFALKA